MNQQHFEGVMSRVRKFSEEVDRIQSNPDPLEDLEQVSSLEDLIPTPKVDVVSSKKSRVKAWSGDVSKEDLEAIKERMSLYIDEFFGEFRVTMDEPRELTQDEIDQLAQEYVSLAAIEDFLKARRQKFREMVFATLDAQANEDGDTPPSQTPGSLSSEVTVGEEAVKVSFKREGGSRKAPTVDWEGLKESLSPEDFRKLCNVTKIDRVVIEAHEAVIPDEQKLMDAVLAGEIDVELVRANLIPGDWTTPRFVVRAK